MNAPPSPTPPNPATKRLESVIGHAVQYATFALAVLGLAALGLALVRHGERPVAEENLRIFHGEPEDLRSLRGIFGDAENFTARGLGQMAVALLLLVPVARVAACVALFRQTRERTQVFVALLVLALLLFSLLLER